MGDFPIPVVEPLVTIHPYSLEAIGSGVSMGMSTMANTSSAIWPVANLAMFIPFAVTKQILVVKMFSYNGAAVAGNIDVGIYDKYGTLLVSSGAVAQAGISVLQEFDIADTPIGPGHYYMAVAMSDIAGRLFRGATFAMGGAATLGMAEMAAAMPLPNPAVFAAVGQNYIPVIGLTTRVVV